MTRRNKIELQKLFSIQTGAPVGQCRIVPVSLSKSSEKLFLAAYSAVFDVDPYVEMFFFPKDTLKLMMFNEEGKVLWKKDLGEGIIPGVWFCPVLAFDLDGDGNDEIWCVGNTNPEHPLGVSNYTLDCLSAEDGKLLKQIPWPHTREGYSQSLSNEFRNFILGGRVHGRPILITVQGTYQDMFFEGFDGGLTQIWETAVPKTAPGARGSHMCPIIDINGDGIDELLWGERCIELSAGRELFCADRDSYRGHSDIIAPVYMDREKAWRFLACRETDPGASPRICMYDAEGNRIWGNVEEGHIDLGWVARLKDGRGHFAMGIKIGNKSCGPAGRFHDSYTEHVFDAETGKPTELGFSVYKTMPVDINGDGYHEIVRGLPSANGDVFDRFGNPAGNIGGSVALSGKITDLPGEQMLAYGEDGNISLWFDKNAADCNFALSRYRNPFYKKALGVLGNGYNWCILGGI